MNEKFDNLLYQYFWEKLDTNLYKVPLDKDNLVGFEVLVFEGGNRKQFVSTITKEVLFEVWMESIPSARDVFLYGEKPCCPTLNWCEYWRDK